MVNPALRHWRVSLGLQTFLSTQVVWLAEWGLSVFRELWRRGGGHTTDRGLPDFREPWRRGGGGAPQIGVYLTSANPGEKEGVDHNPNRDVTPLSRGGKAVGSCNGQ